MLGGKDYDTYLTAYKYNYENALGKQNAEELANAMKTDNMTVIDSVTGTAAMGGMAMMVVGGLLTLTPAAPLGATLTGVGGKVALGGMAARNALGLTEAYTRDEVNSEETKQRYKDLAMDVGGLIIGGAAGRLGLQYGTKLMNNGSGLLKAKLVEHGTDFAISVAGDLAMVGMMSYDQSIGETFKQNAIGIVVSTLTGISASKAMYGGTARRVDANTPKVDTQKADAEVKTEVEAEIAKPTTKAPLSGSENHFYDLSDNEMKDFYRKQIPDITDAELKCLVDQMHRVKNGEPRWLNTEEELDILIGIQAKMDAAKGKIKIIQERSSNIPKTEIPIEIKDLSETDKVYIRSWYNHGNALADDPVFAELFDRVGTTLAKDAVLYRCVAARANDGIDSGSINFLNTIQEGAVIDNTGRYNSAASHPNDALDYSISYGQSYVLKINVPQGTKVLDMRACGQRINEYVLPKNTKYRVKSIDYKTGIVECDLVLDNTIKTEVKPKAEVKSEGTRVGKDPILEGGIRASELTEVAPEARHLAESENITAERKYIENLESNFKRKMSDTNSVEEKQIIQDIIDKTTAENKELVDMMAKDETISNELALNILNSLVKIPNRGTPRSILSIASQFIHPSKYEVKDSFKAKYAKILVSNKNTPREMIPSILEYLQKGNSHLLDLVLNSKNKDFTSIVDILRRTLVPNGMLNHFRYDVSDKKVRFAEYLLNKQDFPNQNIAEIVDIYGCANVDLKFVKQLCDNPDFPPSDIRPLVENIKKNKVGDNQAIYSLEADFKNELAQRLVADKNCPNELITDIINSVSKNQKKLFEAIYVDDNIPKSEIASILYLDYGLNKGIKKLEFAEKTGILISSVGIPEKTLKYLEKYGIDKIKINELVNEISLEMGINGKNIKTSEESKQLLFRNYIANNSDVEAQIAKLDLNKIKNGIPLKYSRAEFLSDVQSILKNLNEQERAEVLNHFSLQIKDGKMEGFPIIPEEQGNFSGVQLSAVEKLTQKIKDFTLNNETTIDNPKMKQLFDSLIKGCPEFAPVIGKAQHGNNGTKGEHKYTVDVHTLKVMQEAFKNPGYQKLDDESKTVLKFAILLHDLGKQEGVIDKGHYEASAKYAVSILNKYNLPDRVKSRIIETIYNHHWFEAYNKGEVGPEMVNAIFRSPRDLDVAIIMGKSDLMGVSDNFHLKVTKTCTPEKFEEFWKQKIQVLRDSEDVRYSKSSLVMDTKFQQTQDRHFPVQKVEINGKKTELQVLNLMDNATSDNLYEYGFAPGTTKDNARFLAHFNDRINGLRVFMSLTSTPTTESVQSLSLISRENSRSYKHQIYGVVADVDMKNVAQASYENIASGKRKTIKDFSKDMYGVLSANTFLRDCLTDELDKSSIKLSKEEYVQLAEKLVDIQYSTQVKDPITVGNKTIPADVVQRALNASRDKLFDGNLHSEIVAINPRVKALVARVSSLQECSTEFLKLAADNNLPIILIGHNDKSGISTPHKVKTTTGTSTEPKTEVKPGAEVRTNETTGTSAQRVLRQELSGMKTRSANGVANPRFTNKEIDNFLNNFTYKDKDGKVKNNAENIVKLLKLDKYKDMSADEIAQIAQKYDSNLGALVELGNIPPVRDGIGKVKASQTYKVVGTKTRVTADGKEKVVEIKKLNSQIEEQLRIIAKHLREDALGVEKEIAEFMKANNLTTDDYEFTHRTKSEQSLFDKLKNYLLDPKNKDKTIADAIKNVKDSVGTRTIIPTRDYTKHPDVQALLAKGDREGAVHLAMRLQSEEMVQNLKTLLSKLKENGIENLGVLRFSNYQGKDGMPYFSPAQLREIKELIDVEFDNLTEMDRKVHRSHGIELETEHFDTTERKSGYTAFQANFRTKDGHIFEWQFRGDIVNEFAEAEHVPYDLRTDKDIVSANPKAKAILDPIREILSLEKMTDDDFKEYNKYLTAYYKYCRERELGFTDAKLETAFDSNKFDRRLKAENLILLHEYSEKLKKAEPTKIPELVAEYNSKLIN